MLNKLILGLFILININAYSQSAYEPIKGSSERKEILDIFRKDCENKCQFKVHHFLISGDWAFANVTPLMGSVEDGEPRWDMFNRVGGIWRQVDWSQGVEIRDDFELIDVPIQNSRIAKIIVKKYPSCPMAIFPKR
jgi:hypothetical protein